MTVKRIRWLAALLALCLLPAGGAAAEAIVYAPVEAAVGEIEAVLWTKDIPVAANDGAGVPIDGEAGTLRFKKAPRR